jgi:hypothetical protein
LNCEFRILNTWKKALLAKDLLKVNRYLVIPC